MEISSDGNEDEDGNEWRERDDDEEPSIFTKIVIDLTSPTLLLSNFPLHKEDIEEIMIALTPVTTVLRFYNVALEAEDVRVILERLPYHVKELGISLSDNNRSTQDIASFLSQNKTLTVLDIEDCHIGDEGIALIANALRYNTTLRNLYISFNRFGLEGSKAIAEMLRCNSSLSTLRAIYCVNGNCALEIIRSLVDNVNLSRLDLSGCEGESNLTWQNVVNVLCGQMILTDLRLYCTPLEEHNDIQRLLNRNKQVQAQVRRLIRYLIGIRQGYGQQGKQGMGALGLLPKEIVMLIAKALWKTRREWTWVDVLEK